MVDPPREVAVNGTVGIVDYLKRMDAGLKAYSLDLSAVGLWACPSVIVADRSKEATMVEGDFAKLSLFDLRHNQIMALPPRIGYVLTSLAVLRVSSNQLTSLPSSIGVMSKSKEKHSCLLAETNSFAANLEELDCSGNAIDQLPPSITNLQKLVKLNIGANAIARLPPNIGIFFPFHVNIRAE